jgi:head-tail adaptor
MTMRTNDNGVERDMTEAEQTAHEAWAKIVQDNAKALAKAAAERATAKAALLDKLGITADEAALLIG